jgi:hypothetical protein
MVSAASSRAVARDGPAKQKSVSPRSNAASAPGGGRWMSGASASMFVIAFHEPAKSSATWSLNFSSESPACSAAKAAHRSCSCSR